MTRQLALMTQPAMILPAKITMEVEVMITMEVTTMEMLKRIPTMKIIMTKSMPTTTMLPKKHSTQKIWPLELLR